MKKISYKYLNFISFEDIDLWDVKRYTRKSISSKYEVIPLSKCIREQQKKYKLDEEEKEYGILGVNNQEGIFDAYLQKGKEINQPYKKMEEDWIAYNPYRINVGSIGIKLKKHLYEYISPAYVVFSCLDNILPKYLFLLFKSEIFNKVIRESTTGSVRQNLTIESLKNIKIPLPSLAEQEAIVNAYENKIQQADQLEKQADQLETEIESYLFSELGVSFQKYEKNQSGKLYFVGYKDLDNWVYNSLEKHFYDDLNNSIYPINTIGKIFNFISRSWKKKVNERREYIELGSIDSDFGILETKTISAEKAPSRATQIVKTGDLIIGTTRPYLKKFAIIDKKQNGFVASSGFSIIEENKDKYNLYFLNEVIKSQIGMYQFDIKVTGALYPAITQTELESLKIPIPPLEKQQEIVDYISALKMQIKDKKNTAQQLKHQAQTDFENQIFS